MMSLTACGNKLTAEQAAEAVMQGETDRLPLVKQTLSFLVNDITIDSMRILIAEEPMHGHLYTTWISNGRNHKETPIIVIVDSIRYDETRKNFIVWETRWDDATKAYVLNSLKL